MSNFYYKDVSLSTLIVNYGEKLAYTGFYLPGPVDICNNLGVYGNNDIMSGSTIVAKAIRPYTNLGYKYLSGASYVDIGQNCVPPNAMYYLNRGVSPAVQNYVITLPTWCTVIFYILIGGGGGSYRNPRNSVYPGGGGEFVHGYMNKPSNLLSLHCYVGGGGYYYDDDNYSDGGDTVLYYAPNTGGDTIDLARAKGGKTPAGVDSPGGGGTGGSFSTGQALIKEGIIGDSNGAGSNDTLNGMFNTTIESTTTITGYDGFQAVDFGSQYSGYGKGGNIHPTDGVVRIYFVV
jgi:hypothetical protein